MIEYRIFDNDFKIFRNGTILKIDKRNGKWKLLKIKPNSHGYYQLYLTNEEGDKRMFQLHRIIYGAYNKHFDLYDYSINNHIDHINGNTKDNRIHNLRRVTHQQNHFNETHAKGYCFHKRSKKYIAQIRVNNRNKHLGYFLTKKEARNAYLEAKKIYHYWT